MGIISIVTFLTSSYCKKDEVNNSLLVTTFEGSTTRPSYQKTSQGPKYQTSFNDNYKSFTNYSAKANLDFTEEKGLPFDMEKSNFEGFKVSDNTISKIDSAKVMISRVLRAKLGAAMDARYPFSKSRSFGKDVSFNECSKNILLFFCRLVSMGQMVSLYIIMWHWKEEEM